MQTVMMMLHGGGSGAGSVNVFLKTDQGDIGWEHSIIGGNGGKSNIENSTRRKRWRWNLHSNLL